MYMSQEMPNLRRFLARFWLSDNQMTIILKVYIISYNLCIGEISIEKFGASFAATEYSCAAEPPVQCSVSHLSRRSEPQ